MTHDIEDLLAMIKTLEERIIQLERELGSTVIINPPDTWYWEHG